MLPFDSKKESVLRKQLEEIHSGTESVSKIDFVDSYSESATYEYRVRVELNDKFNYKIINYKISWKQSSDRWRLHEHTDSGWN